MERTKNKSSYSEEIQISGIHYVNQTSMKPPFPDQFKQIIFGMGCFWGAEKCFWSQKGVYTTAVGYIGGVTANPSYQQVCTGKTEYNEAVLVVYDETVISFDNLLALFWQSHNPTQGMRQGNDRGTQYRSGIYTYNPQQQQKAEDSKATYQNCLKQKDFSEITTEIKSAETFYYAEEYHQQYLAKNPNGYCGLGGTGVLFPK